MTSSSRATRARIICIEGPSAVGKTTLAAALARDLDAVVIPELDAATPPSVTEAPAWFLARHAAAWSRARAIACDAPLVVLDGDPFKGLWYPWVFPEPGAPSLAESIALHRAVVAQSDLAFPDVYFILRASEDALRARRAADVGRARRRFETHLVLIEPQRRYFAALQACAPSRVRFVDTEHQDALTGVVKSALVDVPAESPNSEALLACASEFLMSQLATAGAR